MRYPLVYQPGLLPCAAGPQPGTKALRDGVMEAYPGVTDLGIFNCRPVRGTDATGRRLVPSVHGNGRAWDAGIPATSSGRQLGGHLAALLTSPEVFPFLGIQAVIWWEKAWSLPRPYWHDYFGEDPHHSHLHIEQVPLAASRLTIAEVRQVLRPADEEDDEMTEPEREMLKQAAADAARAKAVSEANVNTLHRIEGTLARIVTKLGA